jgi:hypothetical protein
MLVYPRCWSGRSDEADILLGEELAVAEVLFLSLARVICSGVAPAIKSGINPPASCAFIFHSTPRDFDLIFL